MVFMVLVSRCVLRVGGCLLFCFSVVIRSAMSFLYISHWEAGSFDTAVSASSAKFSNQLWRFEGKLYLGSFCSNDISGSESGMSVLFIKRG